MALFYYCPKCKKVIPFWKTKTKTQLYWCATFWWKMCLECGNQEGVIPRQDRINEVIANAG